MKRFTLRRDELWKRIIRSSFRSAIHFRQGGFLRDEIAGVLMFIENYVHFAKPENEANFVRETNHLITGNKENMNTLAEYATEQLKKHHYREGKREGKLEGKTEIIESAAVVMLHEGVAVPKIAFFLKCPVETIEAIKKRWESGEFSSSRPADN